MAQAVVGKHKVVAVTYQIRDQSGGIFERSDLPVRYVHGVDGPLLEAIERRLEGAQVGDTVELTVSPEEGFGPHRPELTFVDDLENVPPQYRHVGAEVSFSNERGETLEMKVTRIEDGKLTVDGNHPLAGQTVEFRVTVVDVRDATADEIAHGLPDAGGITHH
jgi:FKBP-type peptidyl-prolyl cis-trans isomerase SlyD